MQRPRGRRTLSPVCLGSVLGRRVSRGEESPKVPPAPVKAWVSSGKPRGSAEGC